MASSVLLASMITAFVLSPGFNPYLSRRNSFAPATVGIENTASI
jgi:hypothetical protein